MIIKTTAYQVGEQVFPTIQAAQKSELAVVLKSISETADIKDAEIIAELLVKHADEVVDILTMRPTSKPRARKVHGGTKVRKPKDAPATTPA